MCWICTPARSRCSSRTTAALSGSPRRGKLTPRRRPDFSFLNEIGDRFGNTGTVVITDLEKFTNLPDEQLNEQLLGDELVGWLKAS